MTEKSVLMPVGILICVAVSAMDKFIYDIPNAAYILISVLGLINFPWPAPTDAQKAKIEQTAQAILDARALYPDASLADLYDEATMPPELRKAHQQNDRAVMQAYGMSVKDTTESTCVAELMRRYQALAEQDAGGMTKEQINRELQKGMDDIAAGRVVSPDEVEAEMRRRYGV